MPATDDAAPDANVLRCLPHRPPILRVHRVRSADAETAVVLGREPEGPGALPWAAGAIEAMAQSAALQVGMTRPRDAEPMQGMLVAIKRFELPATPPIGAEITYRVTFVRRHGPTVLLRGEAHAGDLLVARGQLMIWLSVG